MSLFPKPIALAFSTAYFPFKGGAEFALFEVAKRLPQYEWHVVTARMDGTLPSEEVIDGVTVHRFGFGLRTLDKFLLPFLSLLFTVRISQAGRLAFAWSMMASQASVAAAFLKFVRPRTHLVLTLQEGDEETHLARYVGGNNLLYRLVVRPWYRAVFHLADSITAISVYLKKRAEESGAEVVVDLVPNGVDLGRFKPATPRLADGKTRIITASRLVEKNGVADLVEAMNLLPESVELLILGGGPLEESLRKRVHHLGLESRVTFLGSFTQDQEARHLSESDIFVRPALSEGLGIAYLHAMAVGISVVGTPVGGIPDFLEEGETGFFCETKNPESIARVIESIMRDPSRSREVALRGQNLVRTKYEWDSIVGKMHEAFLPRAPRRVLMAAALFPPEAGGPALHASEYRRRFHDDGFVVRTIIFRSVSHLPRWVRHVAYAWRLFLSARHADVIFAHDTVSVGFPAACISFLLRKPLVVRVGGDVLWERTAERGATMLSLKEWYGAGLYRTSPMYYLSRATLYRAKSIIVSSQLIEKLFAEHYAVFSRKITVVGSPIIKRSFSPGNMQQGFFASRLVKYKNLSTVLRALELLPKESAASLVVAGDGPELQSLKAEAFDRKLLNRVTFRGRISEEEVLALTAESGFALAPALTEFNPNYLLRALGGGKPFLVSTEHGLPFPVSGELMFNPRSSEELAERILWITGEGAEKSRELIAAVSFESWETVFEKVKTIVCAS